MMLALMYQANAQGVSPDEFKNTILGRTGKTPTSREHETIGEIIRRWLGAAGK